MAEVPTADKRLRQAEFEEYLRAFSQMHDGMFSMTLIKENGQGYNLVCHAGGSAPKERVALVNSPHDTVGGGSWEVWDIIQRVFDKNGELPEGTKGLVNATLCFASGSTRLTVEQGTIVRSDFHSGEMHP